MATIQIDPQKIAAKCAFLQELSDDACAEFLAAGRLRQMPAGAFVFHQNEQGELFYILIEGKIRLSQLTPEGHQVIIHHVTPGEGLGIIIVLSHMAYPVSAETLEECILLSWDTDTTRELMLKYPQLAINGLNMVAHHFVQISDRYRELATERVERRVAHALLRLVRQVGKKTADGILIDLPLSRQDLGEMTGTTLYSTSRILSQWEKEGWIRTGRTQVELLKPHQIMAIAEDLPAVIPATKA